MSHCVALAEEAAQHVRGAEQDVWIGRFRQEHENVIAAIAFCCEGGVDPQSGLRLIAATSFCKERKMPSVGVNRHLGLNHSGEWK